MNPDPYCNLPVLSDVSMDGEVRYGTLPSKKIYFCLRKMASDEKILVLAHPVLSKPLGGHKDE